MLDSQSQPRLASQQIATTNNWDTVFAVDFRAVNEGIAARGRFPDTFDHTIPAGTFTARISGDFSSWVLTGGAGHLLEMRMTIPEFTYKYGSDPDEVRQDAWVTIQLSLFTETGAEGSGVGGGTPVSFRTRPAGRLLANAQDYAITVLDFGWPGSDSEQALADDCRLMMAGYFNRPDIDDEFEHTFATVHLNSRLAKDGSDFTWIAPTETSYGVIANGAEGGGSFAVMCMVNGHTPPDNHNVSPEVIGTGRAGFLINKPVFLQNMIRPGLAAMFGREPDDEAFFTNCFTIDSDSITNSEQLTIEGFQVNESDTSSDSVTAVLPKRSFSISMLDTRLVINFNGLHHPYYKLIDYLYEAHHYYKIQTQADYDPTTRLFGLKPFEDAAGEDVMSYRAALEKSTFGKVIDVTLLVIDILAVIGTIFKGVSVAKAAQGGGAVVEGGASAASAAPVVGAAKTGAIAGLKSFVLHPWTVLSFSVLTAIGGITLAVIKDAWENAREDNPEKIKPDMQEFATSVLAPVEWPTDAGLTVEDVAFNGGFHITGTPDFTREVSE